MVEQMREYVRRQALLHIAYARSSLPASNRPKVTTRGSRFLQPKFGKDRKSKRRLPWDESSMWHYWIEGCLANSKTRFRKFFRFDPLFTTCTWSTAVPFSQQQNKDIHGCMTLCDGGYHKWTHTMCGMKHPTNQNEGRFSNR
jgi:hypothetical protein